MKIFRFFWQLLPVRIRQTVFKLRFSISKTYKIYRPTYADDGLISEHIVDFMNEEQFRAQKEVMDEFAIKMGYTILTLPTGQGMLIKR